MSDDKVLNGVHVFDAEDGEIMNEKTQNDVLADLQARFDALPPGTVLVPPTDDSDVTDVEFNEPKLMELTTEEDHLRKFIAGYPYTSFRSLCRTLNLAPAEALKRITPLVPDEVNCVWSPEDTLKAFTAEVEGVIEREWEHNE
jgi:hypothetical protein